MKINYNATRPGANRLLQAFASPIREDAEARELDRLDRQNQRSASASKNIAEANLLNQRSSFIEDQPEFLSSQAGAPLPLAKKFSDYIKTGNWGQVEPPTSTDAEGELLAGAPTTITEIPEEIKPLMEKFTRALQTQGGLRGASAANPAQIAQSQGEYQQQGVTDNAVDLARQGKFDEASSLNQAGKIGQKIKRYDNIGTTGGVINTATGEVAAGGNPLIKAFMAKSGAGSTSQDDPNAPWARINDPKKRDDARIRFGAAADKTMEELKENAGKSTEMNQSLDRFIFLNEKNRTGGGYSIPGSQAIAGAFNPEIAEMKSLSDKLTPAMRQGLPGAASDRDISMFRGATVGVEKLPAANKNIAKGLKAANENRIDRAAFMNEYLTERGHLRGADDMWSQYLESNPIFDPKKPEGSYSLNEKRVKYNKWKGAGQERPTGGTGKGKFIGFEK